MIKQGKNLDFHWLVSSTPIWNLEKIVTSFHIDQVLGITSFDSGPLKPSSEEAQLGWTCANDIMYSPKLESSLAIPYEQYDEWYIDDGLKLPSGLEIFVNFGGFTLVTPEESYKDFDPTWEKGSLDFLIPIQERFWAQIEAISPTTYLGIGDNDVIVSKNKEFIDAILEQLHKQTK